MCVILLCKKKKEREFIKNYYFILFYMANVSIDYSLHFSFPSCLLNEKSPIKSKIF